MSMIDTLANTGPRIPEQRPVRGYQSLSQMSEQRSVTQNAETAGETRQRMGSTLSIAEERSLIDATKDIAANLFNAFRNEMREALNHVGIRGEAAADLIRDVGKSFVEAVRSGTGFSFSMMAVAYQETLTQTATSRRIRRSSKSTRSKSSRETICPPTRPPHSSILPIATDRLRLRQSSTGYSNT